MGIYMKYGVFGALMAAEPGVGNGAAPTTPPPSAPPEPVGTASGRVKMCKITKDKEGGRLLFNFQDPAKTVEVFDISKCPEAMNIDAMYHGYQQKLQDSYASSKGNFGDAILSMKEVREQLYAGNWKAEGGGVGANTLWIEALAEIKGKTVDEVLKSVAALNEDQVKAIKALDQVKNMVLKIQIRRAEAELAKSGGTTEVTQAAADVLAGI